MGEVIQQMPMKKGGLKNSVDNGIPVRWVKEYYTNTLMLVVG